MDAVTDAAILAPAGLPSADWNRCRVMTTDADHEALRRVAAGDVDAFEALVRRHERRLHRLCERMLGDAELAREATQETFFKAWRKAATFPRIRHLRPAGPSGRGLNPSREACGLPLSPLGAAPAPKSRVCSALCRIWAG
jgi:Sigma-70 region 2